MLFFLFSKNLHVHLGKNFLVIFLWFELIRPSKKKRNHFTFYKEVHFHILIQFRIIANFQNS